VHECERRQEVGGVSSRLDQEAPIPFRRADEPEQGSLVIDRAAEMLLPEEWRIERPYWTISNLEPVMFANYGPDG
jgi:hypothetical protein